MSTDIIDAKAVWLVFPISLDLNFTAVQSNEAVGKIF